MINISEDLKKLSKKIIKLSENNDPLHIHRLFSTCENKLNLLISIFSLLNINYLFDEEVGILVFSEERNNKTIISPLDFSITKDENVFDMLNKEINVIDDSFLNSILLYVILNHKAMKTSYLFPINKNSIKNYIKRFGTEQLLIKLDITNTKNIVIDYNNPSWKVCKFLSSNIKDVSFVDRVKYDKNVSDLSYSLPVNNRDDKKSLVASNISNYLYGLELINSSLDNLNLNPDIEYLNIEKAVAFNTYSKFKKHDLFSSSKIKLPYKNNKETFTNGDNYDKKIFKTSTGFFKKSFLEIVDNNKYAKEFKIFVIDQIKQDLVFSFEDYSIEFHSIDFWELMSENMIVEVGKNEFSRAYKFNPKYILNKEVSSLKKEKDIYRLYINIIQNHDSDNIKKAKSFFKDYYYYNFSEEDVAENISQLSFYNLFGFNIFKEKKNGQFMFNNYIHKHPVFKMWKFSNKVKSIDSLGIYDYFLFKNSFTYEDLLRFEDTKDIIVINHFIAKLFKKDIIYMKGQEFYFR